MPITDLVSSDEEGTEDASPLPDRTKVKIAGMITAVTQKTTKKEERMAFFTVEDSSGVIECLAFPKTYTQYGEIIKSDNAVFVEGNLSVREDESSKILVSVMGLLVDNAHFNGVPKPVTPPALKVETPPPVREQRPTPGAQEPVAQGATGDRPRAAEGVDNPYEALAPTRADNPDEAMPAAAPPPRQAAAGPAPRSAPHAPAVPPQKIYLRVPDREGEPYRKALNLAEIFCDGATSVIFYDRSDGKYYASNLRMKVTPFVLTRLADVLGKENVAVK